MAASEPKLTCLCWVPNFPPSWVTASGAHRIEHAVMDDYGVVVDVIIAVVRGFACYTDVNGAWCGFVRFLLTKRSISSPMLTFRFVLLRRLALCVAESFRSWTGKHFPAAAVVVAFASAVDGVPNFPFPLLVAMGVTGIATLAPARFMPGLGLRTNDARQVRTPSSGSKRHIYTLPAPSADIRS